MNNPIKFNVPTAQRFILLVLATLLGYIITSVVSMIIIGKGLTAARVCIVTSIQDIFVFILPVILTAMIVTRRPAELLGVMPRGGYRFILLAVLTVLAVIPAMNVVINWNANLPLLHELGELSRMMEEMEKSASETIALMVGGGSVMGLVLMLMVVGIMAGFSEELFFRGGFQRLMLTAGVNGHVAVWAVAIIFSAFHVQFFGFVPRLLLGAIFGYLAWWSGSIWPAVAAHVTNNSLAALMMWLKARGEDGGLTRLETIGQENLLLAAVSLVLTAGLLYVAYSQRCDRTESVEK